MGPAMILDSGNGYHVWLAVDAVTGNAVAATSSEISAAMARVGGDNMSDPPRIARLPLTVNVPTSVKRKRGAVHRLALPELPATAPARRLLSSLCGELTTLADRLNLRGRSSASGGKGKGGRGGGSAKSTTTHGAGANVVIFQGPAPSLELLKDLLDALPNTAGTDRREQVDVAHAVRGAAAGTVFEQEARKLFLD